MKTQGSVTARIYRMNDLEYALWDLGEESGNLDLGDAIRNQMYAWLPLRRFNVLQKPNGIVVWDMRPPVHDDHNPAPHTDCPDPKRCGCECDGCSDAWLAWTKLLPWTVPMVGVWEISYKGWSGIINLSTATGSPVYDWKIKHKTVDKSFIGNSNHLANAKATVVRLILENQSQ